MTSNKRNGGPHHKAAAAKEHPPTQRARTQRTAAGRQTGAPRLSGLGLQVLRAAQERDMELRCTTGFDGLWSVLEHVGDLDEYEREQLLIDGLRWRHWCSLAETARRYEQARRDAARLACVSEQAVHAEIRRQGGIGPSHAELEHRRSQLPQSYRDRVRERGVYRGGPVAWHTGRSPRRSEGRDAA